MNNKKIICLMGPTACGKTSLAIELINKYPIEIINVDSAQIYVGMDIGTNKPSKAELALTKHNLIDICLPNQYYSVAQFCQDAKRLINKIHSNNKIPLLVGGTMLYFYGLCFGLSKLPPKDEAIRNDILALALEYGWPKVYNHLAQLDPGAAKNIDISDSQRIQRALEINLLTGQTVANCFKNLNSFLDGWDVRYFAIMQQDRAILHKNIAARFYSMIQQGFIEEAKWLLDQRIPAVMPSMRCVGYRQIIEYLQNNITKEAAFEKAIIATRQLAKRQYTWLRKWQKLVDVKVLNAEDSLESNMRHIQNSCIIY